jgi:apolipoprotein N-acyltransferase
MAAREILRPILFLLLTVVLLSLSFAPFAQFYLAWIALAPWLVLISRCKTQKSAFLWSWLAGTLFFLANMWWLIGVTAPGMIALTIYCGIYWALAALIIRGAKLLDSEASGVLAIAAVWTATEWLRGHVITGMPLFYLAHSQTPIPELCQVADWGGAYAVTFWVAMLNALIAMMWLGRKKKSVARGAAVVAAVSIFYVAYGIWRIDQTPATLRTGPVVAVIQPNYPQTNSGQKGASLQDRLQLHLDQTDQAIQAAKGKLDLVVWSETMMPPLNLEARMEFAGLAQLYDILCQTVARNHVALLTGAEYESDFADEVRRDGQTYSVAHDSRNSAYLIDAQGHMDPNRYDKIHLLPFGEFIPFKKSLPFLYRIFLQLGPAYYSDYELQSGSPSAMTVFELHTTSAQTTRFVTPICFEDLDADLCSAMFRPTDGSNAKRADFMVNITNDGWFAGGENAVHFQAGIFRAIENRVPIARSVNTGISGFIDSTGNTSHLIPPRTVGFSVGQLMLDSRLTVYTRVGDIFADLCLILSVGIAVSAWIRRNKLRVTNDEK